MASSLSSDGIRVQEEFQLALFRTSKGANLFADRVFDLFDLKRNGVIEFGEFVRSLSTFHPKVPESEKTACTHACLKEHLMALCLRCPQSSTFPKKFLSFSLQLHSNCTI
jgi:hypothetical protein